jgi:hypothetical protein
MPVAKDVQNAVDHEASKLLTKGQSSGPGFPLGDPGTDINVTREGPIGPGQREGEHVGGPLLSPPARVEGLHAIATHEGEKQGGAAALPAKYPLGRAHHGRPGQRGVTTTDCDLPLRPSAPPPFSRSDPRHMPG